MQYVLQGMRSFFIRRHCKSPEKSPEKSPVRHTPYRGFNRSLINRDNQAEGMAAVVSLAAGTVTPGTTVGTGVGDATIPVRGSIA